MKTIRLAALACAVCLATGLPGVHGQEAAPPMTPEQQAMMAAWEKAATPGAQHQQLADHFVGTWNTRQTMWMDPAAPPMVETGKSVNTAVLGGRHVRMDFSGPFMGKPFEGTGYTGYDNVTGKYVSTWQDNMSTGIQLMRGDYDPASRTYTYTGEMPDLMAPGQPTPVREVIRVIDPDHHVMEMHETHGGKEAKTMEIDFKRVR